MAGLTGTDVAADLTLPTTTVKPDENEIQDPSLAGPGSATAGAPIPPPPVHHHPQCGALLSLPNIETVTPGQGMPCRLCVVNHVTSTAATGQPPAVNPDGADTAGLATGGVDLREWGWPVTCHRGQIRLSLHREVPALTIPIPLCTEVTEILTRRRCAPPVLAHPYTPDHWIVLAGQRYDVLLPWPHQVHRVTGVLLLPPTMTPRGPITWVRPPGKDSLQLCREIDLFGALRTALNDLPGQPTARP